MDFKFVDGLMFETNIVHSQVSPVNDGWYSFHFLRWVSPLIHDVNSPQLGEAQ